MDWLDLENQINLLEKDLINSVNVIDVKEKQSQDSLAVQKDNASVLREIESVNKENHTIMSQLDEELKSYDDLKNIYNGLHENVSDFEAKCMEINTTLKIKESDGMRMAKARNMFNIAKHFTGIRWNYSAANNIVSGYITNKDKKTLLPFEFDKTTFTEDKIPTELWNQIEASSTVDWRDLIALCNEEYDKENVSNN